MEIVLNFLWNLLFAKFVAKGLIWYKNFIFKLGQTYIFLFISKYFDVNDYKTKE